MVLHVLRREKNNRTSKTLGDIQPDDLIRQLLGSLPDSRDPVFAHQSGTATDEILLDIHVDGARYLLIRMPTASLSAPALSPREQEIVRMVGKGFSNKMIADFLEISSWTVCTHLRRIFAKLGVVSRAAMVAQLLKDGWIRDHAHSDRGQRDQRMTGLDASCPAADLRTPLGQGAAQAWRSEPDRGRNRPSAAGRHTSNGAGHSRPRNRAEKACPKRAESFEPETA